MAAALLVALRAQFESDLSAFLPRHATANQQILIELLELGPSSRTVLMAIEGADEASRAALSQRLASRLRSSATFEHIANGAAAADEKDQAFLFKQRYLLSPAVEAQRFSTAGLRSAIDASVETLASPVGIFTKSLFLHDPTGELLAVIDSMASSGTPSRRGGVWTSADGGRAVLLAQTRAAGSDTDAQEAAIAQLRVEFARAARELRVNARLILTGPGVFAVESRALIKHEALRLSLISSALVVGLLWAVYRSVTVVALGMVPVVTGALAGIAAVALGFGTVHGLTLGFGITLIGEAVDYAIYWFVQAREQTRDGLWMTIGLGLGTSLIGFAALLGSGFPGLAQLGLYTIAGLAAAGLTTRYVLPSLTPSTFSVRDIAWLGRLPDVLLPSARVSSIALLAAFALSSVCIAARWHAVWAQELSSISPLRADQLQLDAELRQDLGQADVSSMVLVRAATLEKVLQACERVEPVLQALTANGVLAGFENPARFVPSAERQLQRRASIPAASALRERLHDALGSDAPVRADALTEFIENVESARTAPLISRASLAGTSFAAAFDTLLIRKTHGFVAILPLHAPRGSMGARIDTGRIRAALSTAGLASVGVLDLRAESDALYASYVRDALRLASLACAAIAILLLITLRSARAVWDILAPLTVAVAVVAAGLILTGERLTILHLIGMLLIVAVGSNYGLFFRTRVHARVVASLCVANAATVLAFATLASSRVPVLAALGQTVAPGALLALIFSAMAARERLPRA